VESQVKELSNGTNWAGGRLLNIHIAPRASVAMEEVSAANFVAGTGIEGDRYFLGTGTYSAKPDFREVTLFETEVLEALARNDPPLQSGPITLRPVDHRRNLTVRGVPLHHLVGQRFRVGTVVLFGGRLNFPCKTWKSSSACRSICRCTTGRVSIVGSRRAASSTAAIRSNRLDV
jgi:MOSC domain-containing protein YiiM